MTEGESRPDQERARDAAAEQTSGHQIKKKLHEAAQDLRKIAENHPHAGHLQEQAAVIQEVADSSEEVLEGKSPAGKSGQGVCVPDAAKPGKP